MKTDNINLGKYDLNKLLRNPMLIHQIQDNLLSLNQMELLKSGILGAAIVSYAKIAPAACISILSKAGRQEVINLIGKPTMLLIDEYMGGQSQPDPQDIPQNLFLSPTIASKLDEEEKGKIL